LNILRYFNLVSLKGDGMPVGDATHTRFSVPEKFAKGSEFGMGMFTPMGVVETDIQKEGPDIKII